MSAKVSILPCVVGFWLLAGGGCAAGGGTGPVPNSGTSVGETFRDAEKVAGVQPGRQAVLGRGDSMAPAFGENTLMVITPVAWDQLHAGMLVAYVNSKGVRVVHTLLEKTRDGWVVSGTNNDRIDTDLVTPRNLVGIVSATLMKSEDDPAK